MRFLPHRRRVAIPVLLFLATLLLDIPAVKAQGDSGVTSERILIGNEGPMHSFSGDEENRGFELAFAEANAAGGIHGRRIEWRGYAREDGDDTGQAMVNAHRLVEQDHVFALVSFGGPVAIPLAAYAEQAKIPYLFPHTALVDSAGKHYVFTSFPGYGGEAKMMFRYLAQERGLKQIGIVYDANVYGQFFLERLKEYAPAFGYDVVGGAALHTRTPDTLTAELKSLSGASAVVMALYPAQAKALMQAKAQLGFPGRMISVGPLTDEAYLTLPGGVANGTLGFCYYPDPERSDAPGVVQYRAALAHGAPGAAPNRYSMYGYTFGRLIVDALRRAGTDPTRDSFVAALEATHDWSSGAVLPPVTLSATDHHAQTAGFICEMKEGRFVALSDWISP